jgi:hypothetical protein
MEGGGLARSTVVDLPLEITTVLRPRGDGQGVAALVPGKGSQQDRLHAPGQAGIPGLDRTWTISQWMGATDRPVSSREVPLSTVERGAPAGRSWWPKLAWRTPWPRLGRMICTDTSGAGPGPHQHDPHWPRDVSPCVDQANDSASG